MKNLVLMAIVIGCVFLSGCASLIEQETQRAELIMHEQSLLALKTELEAHRKALLLLESALTELENDTLTKVKQILDGMLLIAEQVDTNTEDIKEMKDTLVSVAKILDMSRKVVEIFDERQKELTEKVNRIEDHLAGERL